MQLVIKILKIKIIILKINEKDCIDYKILSSKEYYFELQKVLNLINREIEEYEKEW